ncbi:MAG: hypothetical protein H6643_11040 [Caldilineaceae bacterium]|nr:hypothetical protein [Caldilineaceae bacterium]
MEIEEYFAQAVDRLLTGESIDDILVSYPPSVRGELRSLLVVVEAAERMATVTVPAPASLNRVSARLLFAQRAAELRGDLVAVSAAAPTAALRSTSTATSDKPTLWQRLRDGWDAIRPPAPLLRLAPLTSVLIIAFLLTFTVVVSAQESLPGDQIYGLKEWMFNQRLATAPPELLATERDIIAKEQVDDVGKTAAELNSRPEASAAEAVGTFQYRGEDADFLYFGDLLVTKGYRTDVNDPIMDANVGQRGVAARRRRNASPSDSCWSDGRRRRHQLSDHAGAAAADTGTDSHADTGSECWLPAY